MGAYRVGRVVTPESLYNQLTQSVNDPQFVLRAVQIKFPGWKPKAPANPDALFELPASLGPKIDPLTHSDRVSRADMKKGSAALLDALHKHHPAIMRHAYEAGRLVRFP